MMTRSISHWTKLVKANRGARTLARFELPTFTKHQSYPP